MNTLALLLLATAPARPVPDTTFGDGSWHRVQRPNALYDGLTTPLDSGRCRVNKKAAGRPAAFPTGNWALLPAKFRSPDPTHDFG